MRPVKWNKDIYLILPAEAAESLDNPVRKCMSDYQETNIVICTLHRPLRLMALDPVR
jgi:hypothetical protein